MMNSLCEILQFLSTFVLGLFIGALLAEGALLVPYWRTLSPEQFFSLHKVFGPRLYRFYAPLTITATLLMVSTAIVCWLAEHPGRMATLIAGVLTLSMIAIYFLYFRGANAKFAAASIRAEELSPELARWAKWHWLRVAVGIIAFAVALLGQSRWL